MNAFIDVVLQNSASVQNNEELLQKWFQVIKRVRNQPYGYGKDISKELKAEIENHFQFFWANDRTALLNKKRDTFEQIPLQIQDHIMCQFLFEDILKKTAF